MIRTLLIYLALFSASQVYGECENIVNPHELQFQQFKKNTRSLGRRESPLTRGCDRLLSTEQAKIILNEVNLDFYVLLRNLLSLTSEDQVGLFPGNNMEQLTS